MRASPLRGQERLMQTDQAADLLGIAPKGPGAPFPLYTLKFELSHRPCRRHSRQIALIQSMKVPVVLPSSLPWGMFHTRW